MGQRRERGQKGPRLFSLSASTSWCARFQFRGSDPNLKELKFCWFGTVYLYWSQDSTVARLILNFMPKILQRLCSSIPRIREFGKCSSVGVPMHHQPPWIPEYVALRLKYKLLVTPIKIPRPLITGQHYEIWHSRARCMACRNIYSAPKEAKGSGTAAVVPFLYHSVRKTGTQQLPIEIEIDLFSES